MKLVWLTAECPFPPNSGGRNVMWNKIKLMSKTNEIYLFSIIDSPEENIYKSDLEKYCKEVHLYTRSKSLGTILKCIRYPFPFVSRWSIAMKNDIDIICDSMDIDYIMVEFPQMIGNLSDQAIARHNVILNQHNIEHLAFRDTAKGIANVLKKLVFNLTAWQMECYESDLYKSNKVFMYTFVSSADKKYFEEKYRVKETVLLPIGTELRESLCAKNQHNVVFVAKMSYAPNDTAAKWLLNNVWPLVKEEVVDARLYLVGKDPGQDLRELAERTQDCFVTGAVDSVEKYYDIANIVVVPILTGGGVKVKLIEALGRKKLVVTTVKGLEGTDFLPQEHVLASNNAKEFAGMCINGLLHYDEYLDMRLRAFNLVDSKYSWTGIIARFNDDLERRIVRDEEHK